MNATVCQSAITTVLFDSLSNRLFCAKGCEMMVPTYLALLIYVAPCSVVKEDRFPRKSAGEAV